MMKETPLPRVPLSPWDFAFRIGGAVFPTRLPSGHDLSLLEGIEKGEGGNAPLILWTLVAADDPEAGRGLLHLDAETALRLLAAYVGHYRRWAGDVYRAALAAEAPPAGGAGVDPAAPFN